MYEYLIGEYINKLTEDEIKKHSEKRNIFLNDDETKTLYLYAKNYWREFYRGEDKEIVEEIRQKIRPDTFNQLYTIYLETKEKYQK